MYIHVYYIPTHFIVHIQTINVEIWLSKGNKNCTIRKQEFIIVLSTEITIVLITSLFIIFFLKLAGHSIEETIKKETEGDLQDGYLAIGK